MQLQIESIGTIQARKDFAAKLDPKWRAGLAELEGFGHVAVLWQAHQATWRDDLISVKRPYRGGPNEVGVIATRSPSRPNRICISVAALVSVDMDTCTVNLAWIDAEDGSPVIDIAKTQLGAQLGGNPTTRWAEVERQSFRRLD